MALNSKAHQVFHFIGICGKDFQKLHSQILCINASLTMCISSVSSFVSCMPVLISMSFVASE